MENLLIIGAGQSAIQCISTLKKEGYSGSITLVGEEEHLPYQRPPLSKGFLEDSIGKERFCLLYTSPSPRDRTRSRMPSSA